MFEFDAIVLRFRDLVTALDDTIKEHADCIKRKGFVWWGWWKKGNEQVLFNELAIAHARANSNILNIYLIDSAQKKVYHALCSKIVFDKNNLLPSPDKLQTPDYYNAQNYHAWFGFLEIRECRTFKWNKYSYVDTPSLFYDNGADYAQFADKKIFSVEELIQQNRTLWFIRDAKETDSENEIILLDANVVSPSHFSKKYYQMQGDTILWLSDLHFSDHVFELEERTTKESLAQHIKKYNYYDHTGGLIVTGDIASKGNAAGFDLAREFIKDLSRDLKVPFGSENVIICPGNHDFARKEENLNDSEPEKVIDNLNSVEAFSAFYRSLYYIKPNGFFACGKKLLLTCGRTVEIASLNSVTLQQYIDFQGHGYISQQQLDYVEHGMGWISNENSSAVRIVIMHHHYLPACLYERVDTKHPGSVVYDADRLMKWLVKNNVKLLLHGHKHQTFTSQVSYPAAASEREIDLSSMKSVSVVGMGSTSAKDADNKFATLVFDVNKIQINFYRIYPSGTTSDELIQTLTIPL